MSLRQITPPAALAVSLAAAKESLRIMPGDTDLDVTITLALKAITLEAEHQIGRSLINQQWRLIVDGFHAPLRLDFPPVVSVDSITYYDDDNALQTVAPSLYYADTQSEPGHVALVNGESWPSTFTRYNAVTVDYTAGYGATEAAIPDNIKHYILVRLQEQFDATGREFRDTPQSRYAERLLDVSRTYA